MKTKAKKKAQYLKRVARQVKPKKTNKVSGPFEHFLDRERREAEEALSAANPEETK